MISAEFNVNSLVKDLNGLAEYSIGFLDGVDAGKQNLLNNLGESVIESLKNFIDSNARINPQALHHVYEWYQTGSPAARLFDIQYLLKGNDTLSFNYTFSQSTSFSQGSKVPFYDKANIMEKGIPVTIRPKNSKVLAFEVDGEKIFTSKEVQVSNPGGTEVEGSFERTINLFFNNYFTQSYIVSSGLYGDLKDVSIYKNNVRNGIRGGRSYGQKIGYQWISKGGRIVE